MSGDNRESRNGGWSENTKETRKGKFNPTSEEIKEAMEDFEISGGRIRKVEPIWNEFDPDLISLLDTIGCDEFLIGV